MAEPTEEQRHRAGRLEGLFTGMCQPEEYEDLIEAGLLYRSYEGAAGFMGLSKLRRREDVELTIIGDVAPLLRDGGGR